MAGTELLGQMEYWVEKIRKNGKVTRNEYYLPYKHKSENGRCNGCGDCCSTGLPFSGDKAIDIVNRLQDHIKNEFHGACPLLDEDGCSLGNNIPFACLRSDCSSFENCTEKLIELEIR